VLGNRLRRDRLAQEQVNALSRVVDQFAATLQNCKEEKLRHQAERRMLQQEKLSVLGLISGSLAHEIRNPLSSIKTIATLVTEELGADHPCQHDLGLILSEIDRLSSTSNRLLDFAKPEPQTQRSFGPDQTILRVVAIMEHLARQYHVELMLDLTCPELRIASSEASLSEIVFNLVKNAIEATRGKQDGRVWVRINAERSHD
jgi:signal transduction histidine kinase